MTHARALPAELTIYTAGDVRGQCLTWLGEPADTQAATDTWVLDASAVDQVDAAGVQLLLSLARSLDAQSNTLRLNQASGPLREACTSLGLGDWLAAHSLTGASA
jgi:ABC-type transporter Mla MlaB component